MATDRLHVEDAEAAWIAKYRNALKEIPVQPARSTMVREALNRVHGRIVAHISEIFARSLGANHWNWRKPVQLSKAVPVSQPQLSNPHNNLAEANAKVA